jgi:hypothetical protein
MLKRKTGVIVWNTWLDDLHSQSGMIGTHRLRMVDENPIFGLMKAISNWIRSMSGSSTDGGL